MSNEAKAGAQAPAIKPEIPFVVWKSSYNAPYTSKHIINTDVAFQNVGAHTKGWTLCGKSFWSNNIKNNKYSEKKSECTKCKAKWEKAHPTPEIKSLSTNDCKTVLEIAAGPFGLINTAEAEVHGIKSEDAIIVAVKIKNKNVLA